MPHVCRLVDMDQLADMLANLFKSDARTFHRRLGVLRCFRPDNPTGACPATILSPDQAHPEKKLLNDKFDITCLEMNSSPLWHIALAIHIMTASPLVIVTSV